jgi:hypothetical protein
MIGAASAGAAATGIRSVAAVKLSSFMTPLRMRVMTGSLITAAVILASTSLSGGGA